MQAPDEQQAKEVDEIEIIYSLKLHERIKSEKIDFYITRVAGGWIYQDSKLENVIVFVPFNNEYQ